MIWKTLAFLLLYWTCFEGHPMGCGSSNGLSADVQGTPHVQAVSQAWNSALATLKVSQGQKYDPRKLITRRSGWRTVRIYVSSTFEDFHSERETLAKQVRHRRNGSVQYIPWNMHMAVLCLLYCQFLVDVAYFMWRISPYSLIIYWYWSSKFDWWLLSLLTYTGEMFLALIKRKCISVYMKNICHCWHISQYVYVEHILVNFLGKCSHLLTWLNLNPSIDK